MSILNSQVSNNNLPSGVWPSTTLASQPTWVNTVQAPAADFAVRRVSNGFIVSFYALAGSRAEEFIAKDPEELVGVIAAECMARRLDGQK